MVTLRAKGGANDYSTNAHLIGVQKSCKGGEGSDDRNVFQPDITGGTAENSGSSRSRVCRKSIRDDGASGGQSGVRHSRSGSRIFISSVSLR